MNLTRALAHRSRQLWWALVVPLACSDPSGPAPLAPHYELTRVGTQAMPAIVAYFGASSPAYIAFGRIDIDGADVVWSERRERTVQQPGGPLLLFDEYAVRGTYEVTREHVTFVFPPPANLGPIVLERRGDSLVRQQAVEVLEPDGTEQERLVVVDFVYEPQ